MLWSRGRFQFRPSNKAQRVSISSSLWANAALSSSISFDCGVARSDCRRSDVPLLNSLRRLFSLSYRWTRIFLSGGMVRYGLENKSSLQTWCTQYDGDPCGSGFDWSDGPYTFQAICGFFWSRVPWPVLQLFPFRVVWSEMSKWPLHDNMARSFAQGLWSFVK